MGAADGLNDTAELHRCSCPEQSDVVEHHLIKVLTGYDRADRILGLVLPSPLHVAQPNQGQHLLPAGGGQRGLGTTKSLGQTLPAPALTKGCSPSCWAATRPS